MNSYEYYIKCLDLESSTDLLNGNSVSQVP